jgi:site-specific DNA-methyltransferase (adenine-specific)
MIPSRCFQITTNPGEIVLDPFGGGGSSYEAAELLKRHWIGSEITSCRPILERLSGPFEIRDSLPRKLAAIFR